MLKCCIALAVAAAGCAQPSSSSEPFTCAEPGTGHGIDITVIDSATSAQFPFSNLYAAAVDGEFRDSLQIPLVTGPPTRGVYWLASDREGTYTVTVQASGYQTWTRSGVVERRVDCKIVPAALTVRLQRQQ